jgi:hypothetical protein
MDTTGIRMAAYIVDKYSKIVKELSFPCHAICIVLLYNPSMHMKDVTVG